jgi:hypothetical protein
MSRCLSIQTNTTRVARICAKAVDIEWSVPLVEPDTLEGSPHMTFFAAALVRCSDRVVLLEFN